MTLTNTAYLEIGLATFELSIGLEHTSTLTKSYLMGERGQYLREIVNQTPGTGDFDADRRTGYWIDGGAGNWQIELSFETGLEDVTWGDGSGGTGSSNVTNTDASGADVKPLSRLQVLQYWIAKSKSDSFGTTRVHVGEWTDGSHGESGAFGDPMYVAIRETNFSGPQTQDGPSSMEGTITMSHVAQFGGYGAPDWADDAIGAALEAADFIPDA